MLNSLSWSVAIVLCGARTLTDSRDPMVLDQLRRAMDALIDMARWKTLSHALPAFILGTRRGDAAWKSGSLTRGDRDSVITAAKKKSSKVAWFFLKGMTTCPLQQASTGTAGVGRRLSPFSAVAFRLPKSVLGPLLALAAIAASLAFRAAMVIADILGAIHADLGRRFFADTARKGCSLAHDP
jgi:hypothetical protein